MKKGISLSFARILGSFFVLSLLLANAPCLVPSVHAAGQAIRAEDIDAEMAKLRSKEISYYEKKRIAAVIFIHQDIYRRAVIDGKIKVNEQNVQAFLDMKARLQVDVAEKMNAKYRNRTGENLKSPIIPFAYNNIFSDDDVITGSGKDGPAMEKLYNDSLDEIIRERAGQPMSAADRARLDVNGLAWDMTQKGTLDNYWHKEKYINPQSGYANQVKLMEAGDKTKVIGFDAEGRAVVLTGEEAKKAVSSLTVDRPLVIEGIETRAGLGSMTDYYRMADIHKVGFEGRVTEDDIGHFIRNQKYTERIAGDFMKIAVKDNQELAEGLKKFLDTSDELRNQTTKRGVAEILERAYGIRIIDGDVIDPEKLKEAMRIHQGKQLGDAMPKMMAAVAKNEAYRMAVWLEGIPKDSEKRRQLRKQLALTYAPIPEETVNSIMSDLDQLDIPPEEREWLKKVLKNDAEQVQQYARLMKTPPEELARLLKIDGDNMAAVDHLEARNPEARAFVEELGRRPGGSKLRDFLRSKTAKALNLDMMLDGTRNEKLMSWSVMLLSVTRAYTAANSGEEGVKAAGLAMFEMIPFVSSALQFSKLEFKEAFKELAMDIYPPLVLARIAFAFLDYAGGVAKAQFTESVWDGLVREALRELESETNWEKTETGYFRLKDRQAYLKYLDEVSPGFGRVAKLASRMAPEVDALMSIDPDVQSNEAALHTLNYFEDFHWSGAMDCLWKEYVRKWLTQDSTTEKIRQQVMEGKDFNSEESKVRRVAARIILDDLRIRKEMERKVLEKFIDRIEKRYNELKKDKEETEPNAIITLTQQMLKQMYENAPDDIKKSPCISEKLDLKKEYLRWVAFLKEYTGKDKEDLEIRKEMQSVIDNFRKYMENLKFALELCEEKQSLDLKAHIYGGEKSREKTGDVLMGDAFRIGISARVHPRLSSLSWKIHYYVFNSSSGNLDRLGTVSLESGRFRGGGGGLLVIEEPEKSTEFLVSRDSLKPKFEKEGEYSIYPVLAFGAWGDPLATVGYDALNDPSGSPESFAPDRVAFLGSPANFSVRRAKLGLKLPQVVFQSEQAKAKVYLDLPEYAKDFTGEGTLTVSPPLEGQRPAVEPEKLEPIPADAEKPAVAGIRMTEAMKEGTYFVEAKGRVLGLPDEAMPLPRMETFEYTLQAKSDAGADLKKLLDQMAGLEVQARLLANELQAAEKRFGKTAADADRSLETAEKLAGNLESKASALQAMLAPLPGKIGQAESWAREADRAGAAAAESYQGGEQHVLSACETARAMKGIRNRDELQSMLAKADEEEVAFLNLKSLYEKELENARMASLSAQGVQRDVLAVVREAGKENLDTSEMTQALEAARRAVAEGEGLVGEGETTAGALSSVKDSSASVLEEAGQGASPAEGTERKEVFRQIQALFLRIQQYDGAGKEVLDRMKSRLDSIVWKLPVTEESVNKAVEDVGKMKESIPRDDALADLDKTVQDADASYETASLYKGNLGKWSGDIAVCVGEAGNIFAKYKDPKDAVASMDCSPYPHTVAQWNAAKEAAECVCAEGYVRSRDGSGCTQKETPQVDCSMYPGAVPRWDASRGSYCSCPDGQVWDQAQGRCARKEAAQPQNIDCSRFPGSVPYWDDATQTARCACPQGYEWNNSRTACRPSAASQLRYANCSNIYGSTPVWDAANERVLCQCPAEFVLNRAGNACILNPQAQVARADCRAFAGTVPQWDAAAEKVRCACPPPTQWYPPKSACLTPQQIQALQADCRAWPGAVPQWDPSTQQMRCLCPAGTQWNAGKGACVPVSPPPVTRPGGGGTQPGRCPDGTIDLLGICSGGVRR